MSKVKYQEPTEICRFSYPSKKKGDPEFDYSTSLRKWLEKRLEFSKINKAEFSNHFVMASIEFDKDHSIYVLVPEEIFK